jgi:phenylacetic acid degradation operon negative regulatory protein
MLRSQNIVFTLYGDYLLHRTGSVWVGSLLRLLEPLGIAGGRARTVLSRMVQRGWLEQEKIDGRSCYGLSARGRKLLEEGEARIYHPPRGRKWDGSWHLVAYSIPENNRATRDRLRVQLSWLGCGALGNGLWLSPYPITERVAEIAEELAIVKHVQVFRAQHLGFSDREQLVSTAWDLGAINRRYAKFIRRHESAYASCLRDQDRCGLDPRDCFIRRFKLIHEYRVFAMIDPYLPRELLPDGWNGDTAAKLFEDYHDLLTEAASRFVSSALTLPARKRERAVTSRES